MKITDFFEKYLDKAPIFLEKSSLQSSYTPEDIPHREQQIEDVARILAPAVMGEKPSKLFIY